MEVSQGEVMGLLAGDQGIIQIAAGSPIHYQTVLHASDLQSVQLVHSYNLPPSAEKEETVVEQLLLEASGLQDEAMKTIDDTVISFKKPIFLDHLQEYYRNCQFADATVVCSDETRRVHSLVLGAASSLMKDIFADISTKILDTDLTILMPDTRAAELDILLQPVYGLSDLSHLSSSNILSVDYNKRSMHLCEEATKEAVKEAVVAATRGHFLEAEAGAAGFYQGDGGQGGQPPQGPQGEDVKPRVRQRKPKPKNGKSKYGYKYDGFIDDSEDVDSDDDWEFGNTNKSKKKAKGRPKRIKEEEEAMMMLEEDDIPFIEPLLKVKEEAIERTFHEFNEFFSQQSEMIQSLISFNQDDDGVFHCEASNCIFSTLVRASIQQHVRQSHCGSGYLEARHACPRCGEGWANDLYYQKHLDTTECLLGQELPYVCENCGKGWFNLTNYTRHIEARECKVVADLTNKHKCINCDLAFFSLKNRETHVRKAHMPPEDAQYRCAQCDINFVTHKEFATHRKTIHCDNQPVRYNCRILDCTFVGEKREDLAQHVGTLHPNQIHLCDNCGRNFADDAKLLNHMVSHAKNGKGRKCSGANYDCPHCPREFNRKRHMELHVLFKHSQERPFSCEQCGKKFKTRHCVNIHLRSHGIGGYSWCCEECGKTFNQISAYHVHLKVHSNIRDFACEDCGLTFKLKHSLKKHQLVHKSEFGHTCDFCGKKFKRSDNLINHRRRHTGEHPYKCDKCSWTGPDSSSFIHHKKKHSEPVNNLGTISQGGSHPKPLLFTSNTSHLVDQKPAINIQNIQDMKLQQQVVSLGTLNHPEIKLIHAISKIQ